MGRNARAKSPPFGPSRTPGLAVLDPYQRALGAVRVKDLATAVVLFRQSIVLRPNHYAAHYNLGLALAEQGDFVGAVHANRTAVELQPASLQARTNLAEVLRQLRLHREAFDVCEQALAIDPRFGDVYIVRGTIRLDLGDLDGAIRDLQTAVALKPGLAFGHKTLGRMLVQKGRGDDALKSLETARRLNPDDAELLRLLGDLYTNIGQLSQAFIDYRRSLEINNQDPSTYANLAGMLCHTGQLDLAISVARIAVQLAPDMAAAHANLATALEIQTKNPEAVLAYAEALRCKPEDGKALMSMCRLLRQDCEWESLSVSEALAQSLTYKKGEPTSPFAILNMTTSLTDIQQCCRLWATSQSQDCGPPLATYAPRPEHRRAERLRIGYLSADFQLHATAALIAEIFETHDKSRFETFGYSIGPRDDGPMRRRIVAALDHFDDFNALSHSAAAARIHADEIDVLVDLKGYTFQARPQILAWRPAPIQVNFLGFPGTMAASFIDYLLGDPIVTPMEHQRFYTEKLVHLPDSYQPNDRKRSIASQVPTRAECGLPDDAFVFCCFNSTHKLHETLFDRWMRILKATPKAVLWLLESNARVAANLRREAEACGIDASRVIFAPKRPLADHLARMALGDLFLDTWPYGAHTTASEALWAGLPVLTYLGEAFPARVGASLIQAVGLPELITRSLDEYEARACDLARDGAEIRAIRAKLATQRLTTPLFDSARFTRHLETAFARMAEIRDAGDTPYAFAVRPMEGPTRA